MRAPESDQREAGGGPRDIEDASNPPCVTIGGRLTADHGEHRPARGLAGRRADPRSLQLRGPGFQLVGQVKQSALRHVASNVAGTTPCSRGHFPKLGGRRKQTGHSTPLSETCHSQAGGQAVISFFLCLDGFLASFFATSDDVVCNIEYANLN